jgi:hypothetical protein
VTLRAVLAAALLAMLTISCAPAASTVAPTLEVEAAYGEPTPAGRYDATTVDEASGLAASVRNPGVWWLLDDGRTSTVWAIGAAGELIGPIKLSGFRSRDAEDLAVGPCAPEVARTCVYVGDIGDNSSRRSTIRVARFVEPDLSGGSAGTAGVPLRPVHADVVDLRYPEAPSDAEALLVDMQGTPYVVTKESHRLFRAEGFADSTLADLGPVPLPRSTGPSLDDLAGHLVTSADSRPGRVLLRTYGEAFEYVAPDPRAPLSEFPSWPARMVPSAREPQSESIAYTRDGAGYETLSEGDPTIWLVRRRG